MTIIYTYPALFNCMSNIHIRKGVPMPGNYVTGTKEFADLFIDYSKDGDIHNKKFLKNFSGEEFFPESFFELEKTPVDRDNETFFLKPYASDNSKNIKIITGEFIPPIVPNAHMLQLEILPSLYKGRKFDIRVYVCVSRIGGIMIYKNLFYRINQNPYQEKISSKPESYQFTSPLMTQATGSFFEKVRPGEFPLDNYLTQLETIISKIYTRLVPLANIGIAEDLNCGYMIGGLDFIPSRDNDLLKFLEVNVTPGWATDYGLVYYQEFYKLATEFMLGNDKNTDECIYASINSRY